MVETKWPQMTSQHGAYELHALIARLQARTRMNSHAPGYSHARTRTHAHRPIIAFPRHQRFANAPQYYVIRTLFLLFTLAYPLCRCVSHPSCGRQRLPSLIAFTCRYLLRKRSHSQQSATMATVYYFITFNTFIDFKKRWYIHLTQRLARDWHEESMLYRNIYPVHNISIWLHLTGIH